MRHVGLIYRAVGSPGKLKRGVDGGVPRSRLWVEEPEAGDLGKVALMVQVLLTWVHEPFNQ